MDDRPLLVQIPHGQCLGTRLHDIGIRDLRLIDCGAAQKPGLAVVVIAHDLEHQGGELIAVLHQGEDQPIRMVELGPVETLMTGELFHLRGAEIPTADRLRGPRVLRGKS